MYQWYRSAESEHFPDPTGLRTRIEQWTFGLYPACIKYLISAFDIPEVRNLSLSGRYNTFSLVNYIDGGNIARLWLSLGAIFVRQEYSHYPEEVLSYIMLQSSSTSGFSQPLWFHWCLEATYISALTGFTYTLMRPSLLLELLITSHSRDSTSIVMVILKFSLLQSIR